jgi:hypothetical protein
MHLILHLLDGFDAFAMNICQTNRNVPTSFYSFQHVHVSGVHVIDVHRATALQKVITLLMQLHDFPSSFANCEDWIRKKVHPENLV